VTLGTFRLRWAGAVAAPIAAASLELGLATGDGVDGSVVIVVVRGAGRTPGIRALGWATVEIERAARDLGWAGSTTIADDLLLGARAAVARAVPSGRPDDAPEPAPVPTPRPRAEPGTAVPLVLLEPSTEGLLAGALARRGEGPMAVYVTAPHAVAARALGAADAAGARIVRADSGPLGPAALIRQPGPPGPFLLVVPVP